MSKLAIDGGGPVRSKPFPPWPYFSEDEIEAVTRVLKSGKVNYWTGEEGHLFEKEFAESVGCTYGVTVANGSAALELALMALGIGHGDEVVVTPRTFIASASCIESFEFLLKPGKSSFRRKPESSAFNNFLDSGFHRNDIFGRNSKLSYCNQRGKTGFCRRGFGQREYKCREYKCSFNPEDKSHYLCASCWLALRYGPDYGSGQKKGAFGHRGLCPGPRGGDKKVQSSKFKASSNYEAKLKKDKDQASGEEVDSIRPVGSFGHVACFSFCQDKILTTGGEGGMLITNDEAVFKKAWSYKDHGKSYDAVYNKEHSSGPVLQRGCWLHESIGTNLRLTEIQSAIGRVVLKKLTHWVKLRRRNAEILEGGAKNILP